MKSSWESLTCARWTWECFFIEYLKINWKQLWDSQKTGGKSAVHLADGDGHGVIAVAFLGVARSIKAEKNKARIAECHVLQASIRLALHCQKDEWVGHILRVIFEENILSVRFLNEVSFLQKILGALWVRNLCLAKQCWSPVLSIVAVFPHFGIFEELYAYQASIKSAQLK